MKLEPHPDSRPAVAMAVAAQVERNGEALLFSYSLSAPAGAIRVPQVDRPRRADDLWQTTCFEAFIRGEHGRYLELNFSPSGEWAAYAFDAYRQGRRDIDLQGGPEIAVEEGQGQLSVTALLHLPVELGPPGAPLALSAVVEERGGAKSYWAFAHPVGAPDFHHPDCFVAKLP